MQSSRETVEDIVRVLSEFIVLATKDGIRGRARVEMFLKSQRSFFETIQRTCQEFGVSSRFYFDVLFSPPIDSTKSKGWKYPYLNFLGSASARIVFQKRLEAYKKRIGCFDDVASFVEAKSVANYHAYFGDSFSQGFFDVRNFLEISTGDVSLDEMFLLFHDSPVFTNMFIASHPQYLRLRMGGGEVSKAVGKRVRAEFGILQDRGLVRKFKLARIQCRDEAREGLLNWRDKESWHQTWKILA
jgi:hypothetical protein